MKILFVASEFAPIAKVGGLGDVIAALPKALAKLRLNVSIVIPRYGFISKENLRLIARDIVVPLAKAQEKIELYEMPVPDSRLRVFLIENKNYLSTGPAPYLESTAVAEQKAEIERFVFFSKAVFVLISQGALKADIVHVHDWHAGALVDLMANGKWQMARGKPKTIFTIHNLGNQGKWSADEIDNWFFAEGEEKIFTRFKNDYNFIAEGILHADRVTTVSPTYAKEILTSKYGEKLEKVLQKQKKHLTGILNGIDYDFWNPETDKFIFKNYSAKDFIGGKAENKRALQIGLGLKEAANLPLFGLVARLTPQKGIDFATAVLEKFIEKHDSQFIFLGKGKREYENALIALAKKFPKNIYAKIGFDEQLAHRIYAASDFFLIPSRFEPSGLGQMISMRYGTLPVVRATGGLKDSVRHMKTGFVFEKESSSALRKNFELAHSHYINHRDLIKRMQDNGFKENFDFIKAAEKYKKLYQVMLS